MRLLILGVLLVAMTLTAAVFALSEIAQDEPNCGGSSSSHRKNPLGCDHVEVFEEVLAREEYFYVQYEVPERTKNVVSYGAPPVNSSEASGGSYGQAGTVNAGTKNVIMVNYGDTAKKPFTTVGTNVQLESIHTQHGKAIHLPFEFDSPTDSTAKVQIELEESFYAHLIHPVPWELSAFTAREENGKKDEFRPTRSYNWEGPDGTASRMPGLTGAPGTWEFEVDLPASDSTTMAVGILLSPDFLQPNATTGGPSPPPVFEPLQVLAPLADYYPPEAAAPPPFNPDDRLVYVGVPRGA